MKEQVMTREEVFLNRMKQDKKILDELVAKFPSISHDRLAEIANSVIYRQIQETLKGINDGCRNK